MKHSCVLRILAANIAGDMVCGMVLGPRANTLTSTLPMPSETKPTYATDGSVGIARRFTVVASPTQFSVPPTVAQEVFTSYSTPSQSTMMSVYLPTAHMNMDGGVKLGVGIGIPVGVLAIVLVYMFVRWRDHQREIQDMIAGRSPNYTRANEELGSMPDVRREQQPTPPLFTNPDPFGQLRNADTLDDRDTTVRPGGAESQYSVGTTVRGGSSQGRKPSSAGRKVSWAQ